MNEIERFVVWLYQRTSSRSKVLEARKRMFTFGNRKIENIPPTMGALVQHVKRAVYTKLATYGVNVCRVIPLYLLQPHGVGREQTTPHGDPVGQHCQKASKAWQELLRC